MEELSLAQRERLNTFWSLAHVDKQYREMLLKMRACEKRYEEVYARLSYEDTNGRILEIASQKMVFRFEREE